MVILNFPFRQIWHLYGGELFINTLIKVNFDNIFAYLVMTTNATQHADFDRCRPTQQLFQTFQNFLNNIQHVQGKGEFRDACVFKILHHMVKLRPIFTNLVNSAYSRFQRKKP